MNVNELNVIIQRLVGDGKGESEVGLLIVEESTVWELERVEDREVWESLAEGDVKRVEVRLVGGE